MKMTQIKMPLRLQLKFLVMAVLYIVVCIIPSTYIGVTTLVLALSVAYTYYLCCDPYMWGIEEGDHKKVSVNSEPRPPYYGRNPIRHYWEDLLNLRIMYRNRGHSQVVSLGFALALASVPTRSDRYFNYCYYLENYYNLYSFRDIEDSRTFTLLTRFLLLLLLLALSIYIYFAR